MRGLSPIGGYSVPSFSTLGSHLHHSSLGTLSMTEGTCAPHPNHVFLPVWSVSNREFQVRSGGRCGARTAGATRSCFAHFEV